MLLAVLRQARVNHFFITPLLAQRRQSISTSGFRLNTGDPPTRIDQDGSNEPTIPPYIEKFEEPLKEKRSRLMYQSRKRGISENGLLLGSFADKYLHTFSEEELSLYDRLINLPSNDWDIFYWATGTKTTPAEFDNDIMNKLKEHTKNSERESRYHLPNLKESHQE